MTDNQIALLVFFVLLVIVLTSKGRKRSRHIPARSKRIAWAKWILDQERRIGPKAKKLQMRDYEFDHIVPFAKGGTSDPDNIRVLPKKENRRKGAKMPSFWDRL